MIIKFAFSFKTVKVPTNLLIVSYNLGPKLWTKCCFMKKKCNPQKGGSQYKDVAMPLNSKGINAPHFKRDTVRAPLLAALD